MKIFPTLYEKSGDKIKHWTISVKPGYVNDSIIKVAYGKGDSKIRESFKLIKVGKNIGKSNETTSYEQACSEAESTWKKKLDKGYVEDKADLDKEVLLPMLAHSFEKRKHNIVYPCLCQPKLDGIRCLAKRVDTNTMEYWSREGKQFTTLEHLTPQLLKIVNVGRTFDGEIYSHDIGFQTMISLIKKQRPDSKRLEFHSYDFIGDSDFVDRYSSLVDLFKNIKVEQVNLVLTEWINSEDEVKPMHDKYVKAGYEGLILRNALGGYVLKRRSKNLQKFKEFNDSEFLIVGGTPGTGPEQGCVVFDASDKKGNVFAVRPRGSFELRKKWMKDINNLINKKLTVRYQGLTDEGIPRFPVGIGIRDYE